MTPELKSAIQGVVNAFYMPAKKEYNTFAFNKKPKDHVYRDLLFLSEQVKVNRRRFAGKIYCKGDHEINSLLNCMNDIADTLDLDQDNINWTLHVFDEVSVLCLGKQPVGLTQRAIKTEALKLNQVRMDLNDAKQTILARIRKMLLTQNI